MEAILTVSDLRRVYGRGGAATRALDGVSLTLEPGEFVGVMGPSGSGKTTLLNCISTIDRPTSGSIQVDGEELTGLRGRALTRFRRERLGFIFQDCNLLDTLTAFENIALSLTEGQFRGFDAYRFPEVFDTVTEDDVLAFLQENLTEEHCALSVIRPGQEEGAQA